MENIPLSNNLEIWKDVQGYEGYYQISNLGRVKSLINNIILKHRPNSKGYQRVNFCLGGLKKDFYVHRLVAFAFLPDVENKPHVNHLDGVKSNNNCHNLEWVTALENNVHCIIKLGRKTKRGENHPNTKFNEKDVLKIRELINLNIEVKEISKMYNVSNNSIYQIKNGRSWKHL